MFSDQEISVRLIKGWGTTAPTENQCRGRGSGGGRSGPQRARRPGRRARNRPAKRAGHCRQVSRLTPARICSGTTPGRCLSGRGHPVATRRADRCPQPWSARARSRLCWPGQTASLGPRDTCCSDRRRSRPAAIPTPSATGFVVHPVAEAGRRASGRRPWPHTRRRYPPDGCPRDDLGVCASVFRVRATSVSPRSRLAPR